MNALSRADAEKGGSRAHGTKLVKKEHMSNLICYSWVNGDAFEVLT